MQGKQSKPHTHGMKQKIRKFDILQSTKKKQERRKLLISATQ